MSGNNILALHGLFWSLLTIGLYGLGKALHRHRATWMSAPLVFHVSYREYSQGTHWLVVLLGPATVAFAVPIFEQRALIRRHWLLLVLGVLAGSATALASSWVLSNLLGLDDTLRSSLLPRSMSTPFAMAVSGDIGGVPALTAVFVVITGVLGAAIGGFLLNHLPLRSALARGALLGMGAHGAGTAKALQVNEEIGAIAGLVMVLVGLLNVLLAPLLSQLLLALSA